MVCGEYLHAVVLLVNILQVLLELLQLSETVVCQLPVLLQLTVHFFKLLSGWKRGEDHNSKMLKGKV